MSRLPLHLTAAALVAAVGLAFVATYSRSGTEPERDSIPLGFLLSSNPPGLPVVARPPASQPLVGLATDSYLDITPVRRTMGLDLVKMGWTYNCMECHALLVARWHYDRPMVEHENIEFDHGNNRFCLNCHHPANRNAFVDYDGSEIAQSDVVLLCAKCHGPIHRDWEAGVHGRGNGYWDEKLGPKTRLRCIQCHDPHRPRFPALKPEPPLRYPARAANPPAVLHPHVSRSESHD